MLCRHLIEPGVEMEELRKTLHPHSTHICCFKHFTLSFFSLCWKLYSIHLTNALLFCFYIIKRFNLTTVFSHGCGSIFKNIIKKKEEENRIVLDKELLLDYWCVYANVFSWTTLLFFFLVCFSIFHILWLRYTLLVMVNYNSVNFCWNLTWYCFSIIKLTFVSPILHSIQRNKWWISWIINLFFKVYIYIWL